MVFLFPLNFEPVMTNHDTSIAILESQKMGGDVK